jgi:hypothetical protein
MCLSGGLQHDVPGVRLYFRDDDQRQGAPAQDHRQNVGRFIVSTDIHSSPVPIDTKYRLAQRALVFQRSHVHNLWHSMGEDSADLYVRMCRWVRSVAVCTMQMAKCASTAQECKVYAMAPCRGDIVMQVFSS